jgi:hypothetical protein
MAMTPPEESEQQNQPEPTQPTGAGATVSVQPIPRQQAEQFGVTVLSKSLPNEAINSTASVATEYVHRRPKIYGT